MIIYVSFYEANIVRSTWLFHNVISNLETDSASARSNPHRMASYSASLFYAGNLSQMACSNCLLVGDCRRSLTLDPKDQEAPSTHKVHHSTFSDSPPWTSCWEDSTTKSVMTCSFMDSLGWYSISYSLNFMAHCNILPDRSSLCRMLRRGWSISTTTGWAWKYGRSF